MSSRDVILSSIRRHLPESAPLPPLDGPWIRYDDPRRQFTTVLEQIGGRCVPVADVAALNAALASLPVYVSARQTASLVPGAGRSTVDVQAMDDPHHVVDVEFALLPGEFAVAENAAVWITDATVRHRVLYFACQHLGLVVPAGQIVHNLAEAYQRISLTGPQFGAFLAGPSKTADIEQSLVIGAHGPKSLTVFLLGSPDQ